MSRLPFMLSYSHKKIQLRSISVSAAKKINPRQVNASLHKSRSHPKAASLFKKNVTLPTQITQDCSIHSFEIAECSSRLPFRASNLRRGNSCSNSTYTTLTSAEHMLQKAHAASILSDTQAACSCASGAAPTHMHLTPLPACCRR